MLVDKSIIACCIYSNHFDEVNQFMEDNYEGKVFECVCVWFLCVRRGSKYFNVVSDWLTLVVDLYGTILVGRPLWTQFDDAVALAVVFFALFSCNISFQIFGNLKDIPLI